MQTDLKQRKTDLLIPGEAGGRDGKEGTGGLWGAMNIFTILTVMIILWIYTYVNSYQIACFKYVWFIVCQLYLNKTVKTKIIHLKFLACSKSLLL